MPEPQVDRVQVFFVGGTLLLSIATGIYLIFRSSRGPLLSYTPRRPVPWGPTATTLALLFALLPLTSILVSGGVPAAEGQVDSSEAHEESATHDGLGDVAKLAAAALQEVFIVVGVGFVIAILYRATPRDLGLPSSWPQFLRDGLLGAVACVAAIVPVFATQALLAYVLGIEKSGHELIKMMMAGKSNAILFFAGAIMAVVVAPVCEEIMFRLFLQGWLEKWEDEQLGWRRTSRSDIVSNDEASPAEWSLVVADGGLTTIAMVEPPVEQHLPNDPPKRGLGGLPYGWMPIAISAALFGVAHFGYGPEPVPLLILGLFLGYLYQRTHRIVPCIVCHAVFNFFTMFQLWRMVFHGGE